MNYRLRYTFRVFNVDTLKPCYRKSCKSLKEIKEAIKEYVLETGEVKLDMGAFYYTFGWTKPRESIEVPDVDALPDEFKRVKVEPKKTDIAKYIKGLDALPNWVVVNEGTPSFTIGVRNKEKA
jgi:hypothetical protein